MVRFETILSVATPFDFKFINQRSVKYVGLLDGRVVTYTLNKYDVIKAILKYIDCVHHFTDNSVRSEGMNYVDFKMYDLVPYFYTLLNLYLCVGSSSYSYHRFLPELKITRFCHLPFEDEIVEVSKPVLFVEVARVRDNIRGSFRFLSYVDSYSYCSETLESLVDDIRSTDPLLFEKYDVRLTTP